MEQVMKRIEQLEQNPVGLFAGQVETQGGMIPYWYTTMERDENTSPHVAAGQRFYYSGNGLRDKNITVCFTDTKAEIYFGPNADYNSPYQKCSGRFANHMKTFICDLATRAAGMIENDPTRIRRLVLELRLYRDDDLLSRHLGKVEQDVSGYYDFKVCINTLLKYGSTQKTMSVKGTHGTFHVSFYPATPLSVAVTIQWIPEVSPSANDPAIEYMKQILAEQNWTHCNGRKVIFIPEAIAKGYFDVINMLVPAEAQIQYLPMPVKGENQMFCRIICPEEV